MLPAPWTETLHIAAAVIITRAHCCLTAADHCYIMLGTIKCVDKSVSDNIAHRLDHCDVVALRSGFGVPTGVPHNKAELKTEFKSFTAAHLGSNTNQHTAWTLGGTYIRSSRSVYVPHNLWVSCYNGNNDWSARVLFVQPPQEQGEWLHKTLTVFGFWLHHAPCSLGCWMNNTLAARSFSPNWHQWILNSSQHCCRFQTNHVNRINSLKRNVF